MDSGRPYLFQTAENLKNEAFSETVWVDRYLSSEHDLDRKYGFAEKQKMRPVFDEVSSEIGFPDWVAEIEGRMSTEPGRSRSSRRANDLEREYGGDIFSRLIGLRVGRVVERRRIWRGYLDTVESQPYVTEARAPALCALISTNGYGSLMRENHGIGYHYHYSDNGSRRADILMTFSRKPNDPLKPTTWESHAVGKAGFKARVERWGQKKCHSVHYAMMADLSQFCIGSFVQPGKSHQFLIR
jgi:hypothetical protein